MNISKVARVSVAVMVTALIGCAEESAREVDGAALQALGEGNGIGTNPLGVKEEKVCFRVHNPGDPVPVTVTVTDPPGVWGAAK